MGQATETSKPTAVLVIDDDEVVRNQISAHLELLGMASVDRAIDGNEGWSMMKQRRYELIVLDWKLPGVGGLALFNRIRRRSFYRTTPILVVSGFLEKEDFRLLEEFPSTALIEKPFTAALFQGRLEELLSEHSWYRQNLTMVHSVMQSLSDDDRKVMQLALTILKKAPNPRPLMIMIARQLVKARRLKVAMSLLRRVIDYDSGSVLALNELGKVLHIMGAHDEALQVLHQATTLSPHNLQRLCLMGEAALSMASPDLARQHFEKALMIDADDSKAKAGITIADNMEEDPFPLVEDDHVPRTFASVLNTMGIAYIRNGRFAKGIEQYRASLAFLRSSGDSARVAFNLGLGFLRWGKPAAALPWFKKSERLAPADFGKSSSYVQKLMTDGGMEIELGPYSAAAAVEGKSPAPHASSSPPAAPPEEEFSLAVDTPEAESTPIPAAVALAVDAGDEGNSDEDLRKVRHPEGRRSA